MEQKKLNISLTLIISIILIIIMIAMAVFIFIINDQKAELQNEVQIANAETQKLKNENQKLVNEKQELENENKKLTEKIDKLQDTQDIINRATEALKVTTKASVEELAFNFAAAVYLQDWDALKDITTEDVINELKLYNVTNMDVDLSTLAENPNEPGNYYCYDSYDINYQGSTNKKDFSLGQIMCIDKVNGKYIVTSFCVTGL